MFLGSSHTQRFYRINIYAISVLSKYEDIIEVSQIFLLGNYKNILVISVMINISKNLVFFRTELKCLNKCFEGI